MGDEAVDHGVQALRAWIAGSRIRQVVLDVDLTITSLHSHGALDSSRDEEISDYVASALETDASAVIQLCRDLKLRLGVATFQREVNEGALLGGSRLVRMVLDGLGSSSDVGPDSIVSLGREEYSRMLQNAPRYDKNKMLEDLFGRWGLQDMEEAFSTTLLIDDTENNVRAFAKRGGYGLVARGGNGLKLACAKCVLPCGSSHPLITR